MAKPQLRHDSLEFQNICDAMFKAFAAAKPHLEAAQRHAKQLAAAFTTADKLWERFKALEEATEVLLAISEEDATLQDVMYELVDFFGVFQRASEAQPKSQLVYSHIIDEAMKKADMKNFEHGRTSFNQTMVDGLKYAMGALPLDPSHDEYHKVVDKLAQQWNQQQQHFNSGIDQVSVDPLHDLSCATPKQETVVTMRDKKGEHGDVEIVKLHECGFDDTYEVVHRRAGQEPVRLQFTKKVDGKPTLQKYTEFSSALIAATAYIRHLEAK